MDKKISLDDQISLVRQIMLDKMNLLAVTEGKVGESTVYRIEDEIDVLGSIIQTLKGLKNEKAKVLLNDL